LSSAATLLRMPGPWARDFSSLTANEPLQGIDASRISVLNVSC
jgi:hypothetical protein